MSLDPTLVSWGWDPEWATCLEDAAPEGTEPARVSGRERSHWTLQTAVGPRTAVLPRRSSEDAPVVGDWVAAVPPESETDDWTISAILPRRSKFSRKAAGHRDEEQVVATNVDRVWIVHGLDRPPNPRSLERYLAAAWESGAQPEIVLSKLDVAADLPEAKRIVASVAIDIPVWLTSTKDERGIEEIASSLEAGRTIALLGPSGVGKSSLINRLAEAPLLAEGEVRGRDRKGRHTTTRRLLVQIEGGALLLDTPGMRALPLWEATEGLDAAFPDIEDVAGDCRFRDCRHEEEPGCAVRTAVEEKRLDPERLAAYRKLSEELKAR